MYNSNSMLCSTKGIRTSFCWSKIIFLVKLVPCLPQIKATVLPVYIKIFAFVVNGQIHYYVKLWPSRRKLNFKIRIWYENNVTKWMNKWMNEWMNDWMYELMIEINRTMLQFLSHQFSQHCFCLSSICNACSLKRTPYTQLTIRYLCFNVL